MMLADLDGVVEVVVDVVWRFLAAFLTLTIGRRDAVELFLKI